MTTLTSTDAFFVAYQERSGILMSFGAEIELAGPLVRSALDAAATHALARWPALGQTVRRGLGGLRWDGEPARIVHETDDPLELERWRNTPIDPFREAPFGVLWLRRAPDAHVLAFRSHHAVADGRLFFAIVCELLGVVAGATAPPPRRSVPHTPHPLAFARLWRATRLAPSWRYIRWLAREASAERSARIALRARTPGAVASCDRRLDRAALAARASVERVRPPWLVAAAWLQALHAWNTSRGIAEPMFSLELPVDLRRGAGGLHGVGNHLAVLTLFADARAPLGELARGLWRDYATGVRRRDHLAVPMLGAPARLLPWPVFRRIAANSSTTGFATTHFTWLARDRDVRADVHAASRGALAMTDQRIYTPVCLGMGVGLCVLDWPDAHQLAITHRVTGMSADDASALADLVLASLR
jgi:hypothetical protein